MKLGAWGAQGMHKVILGALAWVPVCFFLGHQLAAILLSKSRDGGPTWRSSTQPPSSLPFF